MRRRRAMTDTVVIPSSSGAVVIAHGVAVTGESGASKPTGSGFFHVTAGSQDAAAASLGTGVKTALSVAVGSAGAPILFNGAGGTPSSLTLTNGTGLPISTGLAG